MMLLFQQNFSSIFTNAKDKNSYKGSMANTKKEILLCKHIIVSN